MASLASYGFNVSQLYEKAAGVDGLPTPSMHIRRTL